jgi:hypothetical protein
MRKLLVVLAVLIGSVAAALWQASPGDAASIPVTAYVYHPSGNSTHQAVLTCGRHDDCDGIFSDPEKKGLDWIYQSNVSYTVWVRVKIYGGGSPQLVVLGTAYNAPSGCKRIWYEMFRYTNPSQRIGWVVNQHSQATGQTYLNLSASQGGSQNSGVVGTMLQSGDNCTSSGPHTMQWYTNTSATNVTKNASIPCTTSSCIPYESGCVLCYRPYGIWQTYEWLFTFWS